MKILLVKSIVYMYQIYRLKLKQFENLNGSKKSFKLRKSFYISLN